jgi:hypothetical protein
MFITCACGHCGQHIEFSADDFQEVHRTPEAIFGQDVKCPGCGMETALLISQAPPKIKGPRKPLSKAAKIIITIFVGVVLTIAAAAAVIHKYGIEAVASTVGLTAGAMIYMAVAVGIFLLAIFWILFPVLMYFQLRRSNALLESVERNTRPAIAKK